MISSSNCNRASELLGCAANVLSIEFYASKYDNKPAELNCRIFNLQPLQESKLKEMAERLNEATKVVREYYAVQLQGEAEGRLRGEPT